MTQGSFHKVGSHFPMPSFGIDIDLNESRHVRKRTKWNVFVLLILGCLVMPIIADLNYHKSNKKEFFY